DQRFTLVSMLEDGDAVAIAWTWAASHIGDIAGFAATGARLTMSGLTLYDFDDENRIRGHWQAVDRLGVYRQLPQNARQKAGKSYPLEVRDDPLALPVAITRRFRAFGPAQFWRQLLLILLFVVLGTAFRGFGLGALARLGDAGGNFAVC